MLKAISNFSAEAELKILTDFTSPQYLHALETSIKYGLGIVLIMLCVGTVLTTLGGGFAARNKKESPAHHH